MFKLPITDLQVKAHQIRRDLIDLLYQTGSGHLDTSLSLVEIWLSLVYSDFFNFDANNGDWDGRDRVFLSEGHACPLQYLINADLGYYNKAEVFEGLRKPHTKFAGHTNRNLEAGFENSNGSLSIGLWQAYGAALGISQQVFCIAGDGEFQEPSAFALFSATHNLKPAPNFTVLLNYNHLAQDDTVDIGPLAKVAEAYNWYVQTVDGHDYNALGEAYLRGIAETLRPTLLICETVKGKGGDKEREGKLGNHGRPPQSEEEYNGYIAGWEAGLN